jgi:RNA polymerase sigma-70 factor (ECF subfamily)
MFAAMAARPDDLIPTRYSLLSRLEHWDDQASWKDFFDTYWRLIYNVGVCSGLSAAEAQDVVQETVICVAKDIHKFKRDPKRGSFKGWLRNLTRWRIRDQLRKRIPGQTDGSDAPSQESESFRLEEIIDPGGPALEDLWDKEWEENLLAAARDRVKRHVREEHFQMFDLYVQKNWPVQKVARTLGVSVGQVYLAKHRVGGLMKKEIQRLKRNLF